MTGGNKWNPDGAGSGMAEMREQEVMDVQDSRGGPCGWSGRSSGGQDLQRLRWRMSEDTCVAADAG